MLHANGWECRRTSLKLPSIKCAGDFTTVSVFPKLLPSVTCNLSAKRHVLLSAVGCKQRLFSKQSQPIDLLARATLPFVCNDDNIVTKNSEIVIVISDHENLKMQRPKDDAVKSRLTV